MVRVQAPSFRKCHRILGVFARSGRRGVAAGNHLDAIERFASRPSGSLLVIAGNEIRDLLHEVLISATGTDFRDMSRARNVYQHRVSTGSLNTRPFTISGRSARARESQSGCDCASGSGDLHPRVPLRRSCACVGYKHFTGSRKWAARPRY